YCPLTKWEQQVVSESQLVDKKGGSYAAIAPKLEPEKFNKWKKRMLCYLAGIEPYYIKCIKDGPFQAKTTEGDTKPKFQWTPDERRVVVQDQHLKSIIMSCLPDDIMKSVISCVSARETWTDLVYNFEGPSDTKEYMIMDLKLEYQTFRAKSTESLSQTYTRYKTLLNELTNDGVNLSKHEINVGFINSLVDETFNWDEEEVFGKEEVTQVKVLMALADNELTVVKNHARNDEWVDITMRKVNTLLSMDEDADWKNYLKYINIDLKFVEEQRLNLLSKNNSKRRQRLMKNG
nr:retrovirus-related Pol polyprotein from transposon TNT 1-94 [Tanacetum cinerariifolium]